MRALRNPFADTDNGGCFACGLNHPSGLHMAFAEDGDDVVCQWQPDPAFGGYGNVLHGGIQSTMMDEIAAWAVFVKLDTAGVTQRMEIDYQRPLHINRGAIWVKAALPIVEGKVACVPVRIEDADGKVCTVARVCYRIFPRNVAERRLGFPGAAAFYAIPSRD